MNKQVEEELGFFPTTDNNAIEKNDVLLPRDSISYSYYMVKRHRVAFCFGFIEILFCFYLMGLCVKHHLSILIILPLFLTFLAVVGTIEFSVNVYKEAVMTRSNRLVLLKEVTTIRPGLDMNKWDSVASKLNSIFFKNESFAGQGFFYNGECCYDLFIYKFLEPCMSGSKKGYFTEELSPFIEEAVKAHQECLNDWWGKISNDQAAESA